MKTGSSYIEARPAKDGGSELVKVNIATGAEQTLVTADQLVAQGKRLDVEDLTLSADEHTAVLFHDSQQVWRSNTQGLFDIYDFRSGKLTPVSSREGRQMFPMDTVPAHHRIT